MSHASLIPDLNHQPPFLHDAVGNKNDDPKSKVVETADAQKFAEQMDIRLFETSAKENLNVEDVSKTVKQQDLSWNRAQEGSFFSFLSHPH